jgi:hypothetical protein
MYQILSSISAALLSLEVNEFLKLNPNFKLIGGPYSDGSYHYQAVQEIKQLNQLNG